MPLKPIGDLKMRVFQDAMRFGHQMQLFIGDRKEGKISVVTDLTLQDVKPGEMIPDEAVLPLDEDSLRHLGEYLIGQGLITAPVTDKERKDHDELKVRFDMQEQLIDQMREQLRDSNTRLSEIAGVVKLAQDLTNKGGKQ